MDLFTPIVGEDRQNHNFRTILATRNGFTMDVINDWARGFIDRDGKFVEEFQTTFNSSFWELYIHAVIKKYGWAVDFSVERPDFYIPSLGINIEATIASNARDAKPEHDWSEPPPSDLNAFNMKSIVRLASAFSSKHRLYQKSYAQLDHVRDRPFILAMANFDQPYGFLGCQRPIEALLNAYYVDEECFLGGDQNATLTGDALMQVAKANGAPIELGVFESPAYSEISAVLFNSCATIGKVRALSSDPNPNIFFSAVRLNMKSNHAHLIQQRKQDYVENLLDGLRVYHNPFARYPIDPALFRNHSVFQVYVADGEWVAEQRDGQLLSRSVSTAITSAPNDLRPARTYLHKKAGVILLELEKAAQSRADSLSRQTRAADRAHAHRRRAERPFWSRRRNLRHDGAARERGVQETTCSARALQQNGMSCCAFNGVRLKSW